MQGMETLGVLTLSRGGAMSTPQTVVSLMAPNKGAIKKFATPPAAPAIEHSAMQCYCRAAMQLFITMCVTITANAAACFYRCTKSIVLGILARSTPTRAQDTALAHIFKFSISISHGPDLRTADGTAFHSTWELDGDGVSGRDGRDI